MGAIDFNADLGESFGLWERGADDALMQVISSANVACGFHAGDPATMRVAVEMAAHYGVAVGSHPGLPDRLGFGRRRMEVSPADVARLRPLPDGRAAGVRHCRRAAAAPRQAPRGAVHDGPRRRAARAGDRRGRRACRRRAAGLHAGRQRGLARRGGGRRPAGRRVLRRPPDAPRRQRRDVRLAGAVRANAGGGGRAGARVRHDRRGDLPGGGGGHRRRRRASACTATRRARTASVPPCVPRSRGQGMRSAASCRPMRKQGWSRAASERPGTEEVQVSDTTDHAERYASQAEAFDAARGAVRPAGRHRCLALGGRLRLLGDHARAGIGAGVQPGRGRHLRARGARPRRVRPAARRHLRDARQQRVRGDVLPALRGIPARDGPDPARVLAARHLDAWPERSRSATRSARGCCSGACSRPG